MVTRRNADGTPTGQAIRSEGAIPYASQIENDSTYPGTYVDDVLTTLYTTVGARQMVKVAGLEINTLNNEQHTHIGGSALYQFVPTHVVVHMEAATGTAATGDFHITIGTSTGGTQVLSSTECTGVIAINTKIVIDLTGAVKAAMPCDGAFYVKVTTADTTAAAGHLADAYIFGEIILGGT